MSLFSLKLNQPFRFRFWQNSQPLPKSFSEKLSSAEQNQPRLSSQNREKFEQLKASYALERQLFL
jgi:hypothetical protein